MGNCIKEWFELNPGKALMLTKMSPSKCKIKIQSLLPRANVHHQHQEYTGCMKTDI